MIRIRLKLLLNNAGVSQAELAKATGIRPSTICNLYNQNANFIKLENIYKICSFLNCRIEELFEMQDD
ncbi:MAG: helix-turn-helix transcriptional regulator [Ruminiclostridium sp.]|nr:helix-turn-helix transcriptional regulator [Ruminiclostridium sp.]